MKSLVAVYAMALPEPLSVAYFLVLFRQSSMYVSNVSVCNFVLLDLRLTPGRRSNVILAWKNVLTSRVP